MKKVTKKAAALTLDDLIKELTPPPLQSGEFTIAMLMEKTGRGWDACERKLRKAYRAGQVDRRKTLVDSAITWAYKFKE